MLWDLSFWRVTLETAKAALRSWEVGVVGKAVELLNPSKDSRVEPWNFLNHCVAESRW